MEYLDWVPSVFHNDFTDWASSVLHSFLDFASVFTSNALYACSMAAIGAGMMMSAQKAIQRAQLRLAGFSFASYMVMLGTFCSKAFQDMYDTVRPVSGFATFDDGDTLRACRLITKFGPTHVLAMQSICNCLLLTPILLLPPVPVYAHTFVQRLENALHSNAVSRFATCLRGLSAPVLSMYIIMAALMLSHTVSVYLLAEQSSEKLIEIEARFVRGNEAFQDTFGHGIATLSGEDGTSVVLTPFQEAKHDTVLPILTACVFVVLAIAQLIVVYERLTNRNFHDDFPGVLLMNALPCLKGVPSVAGRLSAEATKLGQLADYAEKAYVVVESAPAKVEEARKIVDDNLTAIEEKLVPLVRQAMDGQAQNYIAMLDQVESKAIEIMDNAIHAVCQKFGQSTPQSPTGNVQSPAATASKAAAAPAAQTQLSSWFRKGSTAVDVEDGVSMAKSSVSEYFTRSTELLHALGGGDDRRTGGWVASWWDGKLPGSPGFEENVKKGAEDMTHRLFAALRSEAHKYYAMGADWAGAWAEQRIKETVAHIKPTVMSGMDEFLAEARALAAFSERGHSQLVQAYSQIKVLVMQGAPEDFRAAQVEAERIVDMTAKLSFVKTQYWTWGYYLLGLAAFVFVANVSASTLTAVVLMGEHWRTLHKVAAFAMVIPFFGTLIFVNYFWFIAVTGNVYPRAHLRRSKDAYRALLPSSGGSGEPSAPGGDADVDDEDRKWGCCTATGVIVPMVLALGAFGFLCYQVVGALHTPMYERCLQLMEDDVNSTNSSIAMLPAGL